MDATTVTSPHFYLSPNNPLLIIRQLDIRVTQLKHAHGTVRDTLADLSAHTRATLTGEAISLDGREIKASHLRDLLNLRVQQCLFSKKGSHPPTFPLKAETLPLLIKVIEARIVEINHGDEVQYQKVFAQAVENNLAALLECLLSSPHVSNLSRNVPQLIFEHACKLGHTDVIRVLMQSGKFMDIGAYWLGRAVEYACENSHTEIVRMFMQSGRFMDIDANRFDYAFNAACEHGRTDIIQILMQSKKFVGIDANRFGEAFFAACENNHTKIAELIIQSGKFVDIDVFYFGRAFLAACTNGHTDIVQMLMRSDKFADMKAWGFRCAFNSACKHGRTDIVQTLMQSGRFIDIDIYRFVDMDPAWFRTALSSARENGHTEIITILTNQRSGY